MDMSCSKEECVVAEDLATLEEDTVREGFFNSGRSSSIVGVCGCGAYRGGRSYHAIGACGARKGCTVKRNLW